MGMVASLAFVVWMYGAILVVGLFYAPVVLVKPDAIYIGIRAWVRTVMFGARVILGIHWKIEGADLIPDRPVLVASKHFSMMDAILPFLFLKRPVFVLKKELLSLPVFGFYARKAGIAIDRSGQMSALKKMVAEAREHAAQGASIVIFPEGTRQEVGAPPDYKSGVAAIYGLIGMDCLPIAHNGGLMWPAHGVRRYPGLVTFEVQPLIPAGLKRAEFMGMLEDRIESASNRLIADERARRGS